MDWWTLGVLAFELMCGMLGCNHKGLRGSHGEQFGHRVPRSGFRIQGLTQVNPAKGSTAEVWLIKTSIRLRSSCSCFLERAPSQPHVDGLGPFLLNPKGLIGIFCVPKFGIAQCFHGPRVGKGYSMLQFFRVYKCFNNH